MLLASFLVAAGALLGYEFWAVATHRVTYSRAIWRSNMRPFLAMCFGLLFGALLAHWFWLPRECELLLQAPRVVVLPSPTPPPFPARLAAVGAGKYGWSATASRRVVGQAQPDRLFISFLADDATAAAAEAKRLAGTGVVDTLTLTFEVGKVEVQKPTKAEPEGG